MCAGCSSSSVKGWVLLCFMLLSLQKRRLSLICGLRSTAEGLFDLDKTMTIFYGSTSCTWMLLKYIAGDNLGFLFKRKSPFRKKKSYVMRRKGRNFSS